MTSISPRIDIGLNETIVPSFETGESFAVQAGLDRVRIVVLDQREYIAEKQIGLWTLFRRKPGV